MKRRLAFASMLAGLLVLVGQPANAGGWWSYIDLGRRYASPGDTIDIREDILFEDLDAVEPARSGDEPYYAYLIADLDTDMIDRAMSKPFDPDWWDTPDAVTQVGRVTFERWDSNIAWVTVQVRIPEIPSASYALMLCNADCRQPLADVVPSPLTVVQDRLTARLALKLAELSDRFREKVRPLTRSNKSVWARTNRAHERIEQLERRVGLLARRQEKETAPALAWQAFLAGGGAVAIAGWTRRITRRRST